MVYFFKSMNKVIFYLKKYYYYYYYYYSVVLLTEYGFSNLSLNYLLASRRIQQFLSCSGRHLRFNNVRTCWNSHWDISCQVNDGSNSFFVNCGKDKTSFGWVCYTPYNPLCCEFVCPQVGAM